MGFQARIREANQNGTLVVTLPAWYVDEHDLQAGDIHHFDIVD